MFDTTKKLRKVAGVVAGTALAGVIGLGVVAPTGLTDDTHWGAGATDTTVTSTTGGTGGGPVKPADTHWG
ncbi:hypothetical protein [Kitasatospora sp. NPDC101183]|uniref:hypothetical protein n=1 Tax=Kitasatospora sp. NPDC101183 TaxID=3364100 RepID=UPI00380EBE06